MSAVPRLLRRKWLKERENWKKDRLWFGVFFSLFSYQLVASRSSTLQINSYVA